RLPAGALEWHDRRACGVGRDFCAHVASHHVETEIEARGRPGRCEDSAGVDKENVWLTANCGKPARQFCCPKPMRGGAETVERARCRQHKCSCANRGNARTAFERPLE